MSNHMKPSRCLIAAALGLAGAMGTLCAADLPKEGKYDFTACWSGESRLIAFSKTHVAYSYEMTGATLSNPPGGMFDHQSFRCVGSNAIFEKRTSGMAICEAMDRDGDKRLTYFTVAEDGKTTRKTVTGTGKYEGMTEENPVVQPLGPFPTIKAGTFQNCNRQTGSYKMK
jgi:hypothetical protein